MYRDLAMNEEDREILPPRQNIRYDITVIPPAVLAGEYVKTKGHYHPENPPAGIGYPELYQVLAGRCTSFSSEKICLMWWQSLHLPVSLCSFRLGMGM